MGLRFFAAPLCILFAYLFSVFFNTYTELFLKPLHKITLVVKPAFAAQLGYAVAPFIKKRGGVQKPQLHKK